MGDLVGRLKFLTSRSVWEDNFMNLKELNILNLDNDIYFLFLNLK